MKSARERSAGSTMPVNDAGSRSSEGSLGVATGGACGGSGGGVAPQEIASNASAGARRHESDGDRKGTISGLQEGVRLGVEVWGRNWAGGRETSPPRSPSPPRVERGKILAADPSPSPPFGGE